MTLGERQRIPSERINRRQRQILAAAVELFSRKGFHETDVADIARRAGIAKGTMYNYFDDKRALFISAVEWGQKRLLSSIAEATRGEEDPTRKLKKAMAAYLAFFKRNRSLYRLLFLRRNAHRGMGEARPMRRHLAHLSAFEDILREGIGIGVFKNINVHVASFAIAGIIHAHYHDWLSHREATEPGNDSALVNDLVFNGLATRAPTEGDS